MSKRGLPYRIDELLVTYDELLEELRSYPGLRLEFYPSKPRDIPMVIMGDSEPTLILTARMHGDEPTGTEALRRFIRHRRGFGYRFVIFPIVNTHGCEYNTRGNIHQRDVTNYFKDAEGYEAVALRSALERFEPRVVLDLHNTNFLTERSKNPKGYLLPANNRASMDMAIYIIEYLRANGLSDLVREEMSPNYFLDPSKVSRYRKVLDGVFTDRMDESCFKATTSRLNIAHVCVESPGKTKSFFFDEEEDVDRYVENFERFVDFHHLSILAAIEYLEARGS
jgi:hypothetical protein